MAIESKMNRGPIGRFSSPKKDRPSSSSRAWIWIVGFIIIVILASSFYYIYQDVWKNADSEVSIASGEYQAVFLDNGQVYFGQLDIGREFYTLTDVFYLQSGQMIEQNANLALTKLGSEAHGPEDNMQINPDHVLFIENMKNDSKIVQAIEQYKSNN